MSTQTSMNIKDQGHSLILVEGHSDSTFQNFFSLENARLMWSLHKMGNENEDTNGLCHMTKVDAMPIYGKIT